MIVALLATLVVQQDTAGVTGRDGPVAAVCSQTAGIARTACEAEREAEGAGETLFYGDDTLSDDRPPIVCVRDGNTLELNACAAEDLAAEQARMQRYFDAAMTRAVEGDAQSGAFGEERTHQAAWLEASQESWKAYAAIRCAGVFDQWKGGTIRNMMIIGCRIEAARQRTHDIWTDHLTYMDSTPPVLPEPLISIAKEQQRSDQR